jgi:hypothetical protein
MTKPPVACFNCRKKPSNCTCFEYRLVKFDDEHAAVFVDNVCLDPVSDHETGTWQPRANAKVRQRPVYTDGFGPILYINNGREGHRVNKEMVKIMIEEGRFFYLKFKGMEGFRVPAFDKDRIRRHAFLRHPRARKKSLS